MTLTIDDDVFMEMVEPLRGELTAHCYRMLGSVHDAEDLVQETYLRAWRGLRPVRAAVLSADLDVPDRHQRLPHRAGRPPSPADADRAGPAEPVDPHDALHPNHEVSWLEPLPDSVVWAGPADDPAGAVVSRESVRLAFVAALQHLTPPQRAILILRDVLDWRASEVAELLDLSVAAVNSSLQRARAHVHRLDPDASGRAAR